MVDLAVLVMVVQMQGRDSIRSTAAVQGRLKRRPNTNAVLTDHNAVDLVGLQYSVRNGERESYWEESNWVNNRGRVNSVISYDGGMSR